MKKGTKLLLGGLTVAAAAAGAIGAVIMKTNRKPKRRGRAPLPQSSWARPGMTVTFRAELMPGRGADQRTFKVTDLLPSGRVLLDRVAGEHAQKEFEQGQN